MAYPDDPDMPPFERDFDRDDVSARLALTKQKMAAYRAETVSEAATVARPVSPYPKPAPRPKKKNIAEDAAAPDEVEDPTLEVDVVADDAASQDEIEAEIESAQAAAERVLGKLPMVLSGARPREGQIAMARAVARTLHMQAIMKKPTNLVVEGGTGIGKSFAYLVPAIRMALTQGGRVLVATSHKPLQDQIAKKDLPTLETLFKKLGFASFKYVTLKGISNYVCWHAVAQEEGRILADPTARRVIEFATQTSDFSGDFEDLPFAVNNETKGVLSVDSEECLRSKCPEFSRCYAMHARRRAESADIVVTNHTLLTLDIAAEGEIIPGQFAAYIIDEGHNFEDNATRANGKVVTFGGIRRFLAAEPLKTMAAGSQTQLDRLTQARQAFERLQDDVRGFFSIPAESRVGGYSIEEENRRPIASEMPSGVELATLVKDLSEALRGSPKANDEEKVRADRVVKQGLALAERLKALALPFDPNLVYYVERNLPPGGSFGQRTDPSRYTYVLSAMPVDVSDALQSFFAEHCVVLTSATLSDGQSFDFIAKRLGLSQPDTLIVPSPFDYGRQVRLFFPSGAGGGRNGSLTYDELAQRIAALIDAAHGTRVLALFTSHAAMEGVYRRIGHPGGAGGISAALNRPTFKQGAAQMQRLIDQFQNTHDGVLCGTRSWWQGVDMPGMGMVILDKLPFPQLNDPIVRARSDAIDAEGRSAFTEFMMPLAIITFRQGAGRLMRKEDDGGVIAVCDERIVKQRYGSRFIKSLPPMSVLATLDEVDSFLHRDDE